ncbi:MAG: 3-oxoacyl-ACP reductase FabG [Pseudomonadota bacterium]
MTLVKYPDLKDKTILITGASRGIGRKVAEAMAQQGAHVVINFLPNEEGAPQMQEELQAMGGKATPIVFDVTNNAQIKESIDSFIKECGPVHGLVNNAGISKDVLALRIKEEDISRTLDINLKGAMLVTAALTRNFLSAPNASIVNISSVVGLMGNASQMAYSASKAGMIGFTKSYAKEMALKNVRCNAICPGFIRTAMTDALDPKVKEAYLTSIPLKRFGETDDVAALISFLLSQASSYITGAVIKIDGGLYI